MPNVVGTVHFEGFVRAIKNTDTLRFILNHIIPRVNYNKISTFFLNKTIKASKIAMELNYNEKTDRLPISTYACNIDFPC